MNVTLTPRGFELLQHDVYADSAKITRLAQASSCIGDYEDSMDRPGTSFLWIGDNHHLSREEVKQFVQHLQNWLDTGKLVIATQEAAP